MLPFTVLPFSTILRRPPHAWARMRGSEAYPDLWGSVRFYETARGVLVVSEFMGLPLAEGACQDPVFAFHIHGGGSCTGSSDDPFSDAGAHFDPLHCPHPYHAGDLPPIFGANGYGFSACLTHRFRVADILGKTVILHRGLDDFSSQPGGNAGARIACGVIR